MHNDPASRRRGRRLITRITTDVADRHDAVLSLNTRPNGRLTVLLPRAESAGPGPVTTSRRELGHSGADGGGRWAIAGGSCRSAVAADPESAAPDDGVTLEWARERLRASPGAMLRSPSRTTRREPTRGPDQRRRRAAGYAAVGDCRAAPLAGDNAVGLQHVGTDQSVLAILTATDEATSERFHQRFQLSFIASSAADRWTLDPAISSGGCAGGCDGRASHAERWRSVERTPAAGSASARSVSRTSGDGGGAVPGLPDAVRDRRAAATAGHVPGLRGRRARQRRHHWGSTAPAAIPSVTDLEDRTMTCRASSRCLSWRR